MQYTLRPRQIEASNKGVQALYNYKGKMPFEYASCGFGKSLVIADMVHKLNEPTLVLQPQKEILEQNYTKMVSYGVPDVTMYSASMKKKELGHITYATIGSIYKKPEEFKQFKYIIIDEVNKVNPAHLKSMYGEFFKAIGDPPMLGVTGTPFRTVQGWIKEKRFEKGREIEETFYTSKIVPLNRIYNKDKGGFTFGSMVYKAEMEDIIKDGHLCRPEYDMSYSGAFDYSKLKVNTTGADFDKIALEEFVNSHDRVKNVVSACHDYNKRNLNLVFCSSIRQATTISNMLNQSGLKCGVIHSKLTDKERTKVYNQFRNGDIKHLTNVGVMTTGVDIPWLDTIIYARPTLSPELWVQSCARVIRKDPDNPDKTAIIVDIAGVSKRFGKIEKIRMEKDGYKDIIMSEFGELSGKMLAKFKLKQKE